MTGRMRTALQDALRSPVRRVHDQEHGRPAWKHHPATLHALRKRGWLEYVELRSRQGNLVQQWSVTELGRAALRPPKLVGTEKPVFMARVSGTTSERAMAIDDAELADPPSAAWLRVSREKRAGAQDPRKVAGKLARSLRAA